jgi:hypothetical protein
MVLVGLMGIQPSDSLTHLPSLSGYRVTCCSLKFAFSSPSPRQKAGEALLDSH